MAEEVDMTKFWRSMLSAQKKIENAVKDSKNPHLKNTYASLNAVMDAVKKIYNDEGIVVTQSVSAEKDGYVVVETTLIHAESAGGIRGTCPVPVKHKFKDGVDLGPDAQELGSAVTYGRRYGLQAISFIASEDDDGNAAVGKPPEQKSAEPAKSDSERRAEIDNKLKATLVFTKKA